MYMYTSYVVVHTAAHLYEKKNQLGFDIGNDNNTRARAHIFIINSVS